MAKAFKDMNKEELIAATESLKLTEQVKASAKDPEKITNAEYVTVLEAFKASQDNINSDTKKELDKEENKPKESKDSEEVSLKKVVDQHEKAALKQIKYKYIVTDHANNVTIEDDDETRTFPIQYGNLTTGPKNWNVGLHGNPQALPFSVAKKLEAIQMVVHTKDGNGNPIAKSQPRFRVTKVDGWTEEEIEQLKRAQNTRKFKN